jgi:phosphohistidine phosphatase
MSSWDDPALADHDRPLAPRGRRAGELIAGHLRERAIAPDLVLCSSALRTRQTLELVAAGFSGSSEPTIEIDIGIYAASSDDLLDRLRRTPEDIVNVLLIGHQPAIQDLALSLVGAGPGLEELSGKFPTAALATFDVQGKWRDLAPGTGTFAGMVRPKELDRG